jgi:hypothetical protein
MRVLLCSAWALATLASPAVAGGEKTMTQLLAEGFEFKVAAEGFVILQMTSSSLVGRDAAPAFLCPVEPARLLASLREAICEPLMRS